MVKLKRKPVRVIIEDVYLLVSPKIIQDYDLEEEELRLQAVKGKIGSVRNIFGCKITRVGYRFENETFVESLVTKIVDNLQVTIKNIHLKYEDDSVLTETPYSIGFTLDELSAVSTDEDWVPSFINITQSLTRKLLTLKNLSCYMDTQGTELYSNLDREEMHDAFQNVD